MLCCRRSSLASSGFHCWDAVEHETANFEAQITPQFSLLWKISHKRACARMRVVLILGHCGCAHYCAIRCWFKVVADVVDSAHFERSVVLKHGRLFKVVAKIHAIALQIPVV